MLHFIPSRPYLTNSSEKNYQKEVIDVGISDYQLIYCTRKIKKFSIACIIRFRFDLSIRAKYRAVIFTNALETVQFSKLRYFFSCNHCLLRSSQ